MFVYLFVIFFLFVCSLRFVCLLSILFLCVHYGLYDKFTCGCTCLCVMYVVTCVTWGPGGIVT